MQACRKHYRLAIPENKSRLDFSGGFQFNTLLPFEFAMSR
jgi:hypothetical protein